MVATMTSVLSSTHTLMQMFNGKIQEFANEIENVHMVWLEEIQQEANRMFSSDFSAEPELMPKTPSQKKSNRRKRLSGQNENRTKRRFSKGKRSNLRRSSVSTSLNLIAEDEGGSPVTREEMVKPPRSRRAKRTTQPEAASPVCSTRKGAAPTNSPPEEMEYEAPSKHIQEERMQPEEAASKRESFSSVASQPHCLTPPQTHSHIAEAIVKISASEQRSADLQINPNPDRSPSRTATKMAIAAGATPPGPRRSSVRHSLTVRRSLAGLRHSMTQESVRRASRRSFLKKKKKARRGSSTCSSNVSEQEDAWTEPDGHEVQVQTDGELSEEPAKTKTDSPAPETSPEDNTVQDHPGVLSVTEVRRFTRSMAQTTPTVPPPASIISKAKTATPDSGSDGSGKKPPSSLGPRLSAKRRAAADEFQSPRKKPSPPVKSQSVRPNMRSFLHTVQKNQMLMTTPSSLGRNMVMKSFIKHTTPGRADLKERERLKLEALKKKQEQEDERKKKMEEEKRRKQEEMKKKRDERLRRVVEARVKEEQKEEEKKKKIEQKMLQIDEKHDKLRVERMAEEKAKKKVATKRQEELELRRKMEEDVRRKKIQQSEEEEKRQQELQAKRRAEEEQERARKMTEARRALELKKELERELERERQASAERERVEREKAIALQRDVEKAAREKERRELEKRKREEQQRQAEEERRREAERLAERQREAEKLAERQREAERLAERQREAERLAERQREAERLAERQREAERLAERQREAERLAERQREAEKLAERQREAAKSHLTAEVQVLKTPVGKGGVLNVTVDIEQSPQSYEITPKGGNKPVVLNTNPEDYGMDQNSDDSTDDESAPRKPIPTWAEGNQLKQSMMKQYFHPADVDSHYGAIEPPKLDRIFCKSKPRYFKRTSSAVWHSPPRMGALPL